jgi:hypothetical protein
MIAGGYPVRRGWGLEVDMKIAKLDKRTRRVLNDFDAVVPECGLDAMVHVATFRDRGVKLWRLIVGSVHADPAENRTIGVVRSFTTVPPRYARQFDRRTLGEILAAATAAGKTFPSGESY